MKGVQATGEAYALHSPKERTFGTSKLNIVSRSFWGNFCPYASGSGSSRPKSMRIHADPDKQHWQKYLLLKGQCHKIFCFRFFSCIIFPQAPKNNIRIVSNFFQNLLRYSQVKVHLRYQWHQNRWCCWYWWQICHRCQDTGGKYAVGVNNTGGKLPLVSITPTANNGKNIRLLTP